MPMRSFARWFLPGCLIVGLWLLTPARASAVSFTTTESAEVGEGTATVSADCTGCAVFQTHGPFVEEIGTHGEWTVPVLPATNTLFFAFCEVSTPCATPEGATDVNFLTDIPNTPGVDLVTAVANPVNSLGVALGAGYWASIGITSYVLTDLGASPDSAQNSLSDFLTLTISPHPGAVNNISLDGDFRSDAVPEPASLILLGTGLIGAGVRFRKQRKSAR